MRIAGVLFYTAQPMRIRIAARDEHQDAEAAIEGRPLLFHSTSFLFFSGSSTTQFFFLNSFSPVVVSGLF